MKSKIVSETKDYFKCKSCNITSQTIDRMCPCPRQHCDAVHKGIITITTITIIHPKNVKTKNSEKGKKES